MLATGSLLGLGVAALAGAYAWRIEPHWLEVVRRPLPVPDLPATLEGGSLIQLSDLHVGGLMEDAYVARVFALACSLEPDFVAYTGDFVSFRLGDPLRRFERALAGAPRGRIGTVAVLGNHDYGHGRLNSRYEERHATAVVERLARAGAIVLRNASVTIAGLTFVGLDDLWSGRLDVLEALAGAPPDAPAIHLCHNPDGADEPGWKGRRGWILSGHTHGGQVRLPGLPPPVALVRNKRYIRGVVDLGDGRCLYVSRGAGYVLPLRVGARPELTVFTLRRA